MSISLRVLCLLSAAILPLSAQKAKAAQKPDKSDNGITVRLVASDVQEGQEKVFIQTDEKKSEPLDLPTNRLSDPVAVAGRSIVLKAVAGEAALCNVTLPGEGRSFVVLLAAEKPTGYASVVVRADDPDFKAGDVFFLNRSTKTLVMKLGGTELVIEPGQSAKSRPTTAVDNMYQVLISERDTAGDKLISSTRWPAEDAARSYVFLTTDDRGRTIYRAVTEHLEAEKKTKPAKKRSK
ncbi:MAG: hypothetical protein ABIT37_25600 [Luteolibacter sp.]